MRYIPSVTWASQGVITYVSGVAAISRAPRTELTDLSNKLSGWPIWPDAPRTATRTILLDMNKGVSFQTSLYSVD